jgi:hypothetical protein
MVTFETNGNSLFLTTRSNGQTVRTQLTVNEPFSMSFDFTSASEKAILGELQAGKYTLLAYKGATGPSQVSAGLPTWFSVPFGSIFGRVMIDYTPQYQVYVFNQSKIAPNTVISMDVASNPILLGNALNFLADGSFTSAGTSPEGTITLKDQRPAGSPVVTVGLAGQVTLPTGTQYLPFCAFTLTPQGSIEMAPTESVALMAAQLNLVSGTVNANASAPGCSFTFNSANIAYELMVEPSTYAITNQPGTTPVNPMSSGEALSFLNS